jgi:hypothetical protein
MERKTTMIALMGLNALFYGIDLLILYRRYFENPQKYSQTFNFNVLLSFALSLFLMIPTVIAYFMFFNYLKQQERIERLGDMLMITMINLVFVVLAAFVPQAYAM